MQLGLAALVVLAVASATVPSSRAQDAASVGSDNTYMATTSVLTSVKDLEAFADGVYASRWDIAKAARVDGFVMEKDAAKWTLTGWVFLREPVRGVRNRAIFFGDGRFQLEPPIELERQQARRFLKQDVVDQPVKQIFFRFNGVDEQQRLEGLTYSSEEAARAEAENEDAKEWLTGVRKYLEKGETPEQLARRRFGEFFLALQSYQRLLDPAKAGWLNADMKVKGPEKPDPSQDPLEGLEFDFNPESLTEVSLNGTFKHEKGSAGSTICNFHAAGQYAGDLQWAGTSPYIEKEIESYFEVDVPKHVMKLDLTPGDKIDTRMASDMDVLVRKDGLKAFTFAVNQFSKVTRVTIDGKDVEFYQPAVPDRPDLHSSYAVCAIPRKFSKGETFKAHVDLEASIFERFDSATWQVNAELNWFPDPSGGALGDMPTVFDTTIRAPKGWTALANGRLQDCAAEDVQPGKECYRYVTNIGIDFATINIARDMRADKGLSLAEDADRDGKEDPRIPISIWTNSTAKRTFPILDPVTNEIVQYRDYSLSENGPDVLGRAQVAHKVYTDWFGPCPYDALTITPHPKGHGRGSASLLCISQEAFLSNTAFAELASLQKTTFRPWRMTWFLSHEIGHQWWGGASRIRDGELSQWFSEGFAQYASFLVLEERDKGSDTNWFREALVGDREYLVKDDGYAHGLTSVAYGNRWASAENPDGYKWNRQDYLYGKGCMILHSLRMLARARVRPEPPEKGDELFKKAMHAFIAECGGTKAPSNLDLMRSLERSYDMPLDWFFKQWVFGLGIPKADFSYDISTDAAGKTVILVRIHQKQGGTPFQFPLAVSLWQGKKELGFDYQWVGKTDTELKIVLDGVKPDKVTVNEDLGVLGLFKEVPWTGAAAGQ